MRRPPGGPHHRRGRGGSRPTALAWIAIATALSAALPAQEASLTQEASPRQETAAPGDAPVYPGRTLLFSPYARSALVAPLDGRGGLGGELSGGVSFEPVQWPRAGLRLGGGYRYAPGEGDEAADGGAAADGATVAAPFLGPALQYHLTAGDLVGIVPAAGLNLAVPIENYAAGLAAELAVEVEGRLHLAERGLLTLHLAVTAPVGSPLPPTLALGFGIRRTRPVMRPFPGPAAVVVVAPERFSPDGDGERDTMTIRLESAYPETTARWEIRMFDPEEHLFLLRDGSGAPPEEILWDGRSDEGELVSSASDYRIEFTVEDLIGRTATAHRAFVTDILVIEEDGRYKIRIPSITFPPGSADFALLDDEAVIERNRKVLEELAVIFGRFPEYQIRIEGHANMVYFLDAERGRREQLEELLPLSRDRAAAVADRLVELGIERARMTPVGIGADRPIVPFGDADNRWKNRRVEFILLRPDETYTVYD